ncbi:hypothetical protein FOCC_FOCC016083 [Frankliniella occidentalis]|nr:hypothetical protein FOCC_FOCC016083 [Frankliniella occidentalis]
MYLGSLVGRVNFCTQFRELLDNKFICSFKVPTNMKSEVCLFFWSLNLPLITLQNSTIDC